VDSLTTERDGAAGLRALKAVNRKHIVNMRSLKRVRFV
jgi:hypothetical protein